MGGTDSPWLLLRSDLSATMFRFGEAMLLTLSPMATALGVDLADADLASAGRSAWVPSAELLRHLAEQNPSFCELWVTAAAEVCQRTLDKRRAAHLQASKRRRRRQRRRIRAVITGLGMVTAVGVAAASLDWQDVALIILTVGVLALVIGQPSVLRGWGLVWWRSAETLLASALTLISAVAHAWLPVLIVDTAVVGGFTGLVVAAVRKARR